MSFANYTTPAGQSGLETKLRAIQEDLRKLKICESATIRVEQTTRGQVLTAVGRGGGGGSGGSVRKLTIQTVLSNSVECLDGEDVLVVGMPPMFRNAASPRNITILGRTVSESIYPAYAVGEQIIAARIQDDDFEWVDISVGRCWRIDLREFAVCIAGDDNWRILVAGSAPYRPT